MDHYDLVVAGAGLTGLTAAYRCAQAGKSVLVLEARNRVGGRTLTVTDTYQGKPSHFDLGAHFIGHEVYQASVWNMVEELGLETFKQYEGPENVMPTPDKFWAGQGANFQASKMDTASPDIETYVGTTIPKSAAGQAYILYLEQLSQSVWLTSPEKTPNAEALDKLSVWDWVCRTDLPGYGVPVQPDVGSITTDFGNIPNAFRALTRMLCRVGFSAEPEEISMLWLMFYIRSSGGLQMFQSLRFPVQGAQGYRLKDGAQSIALTLTEKLEVLQPGCIRLGEPVESLRMNAQGEFTDVIVGGSQICTAGQLLVAMSPKLSTSIKYYDANNNIILDRSSIADAMPNSHMVMSYVTFDTAFWRNDTKQRTGRINGLPMPDEVNVAEYGLSGDALCTDGPVVWTMDNCSAEGQPALFAFVVGDAARNLPTKSDREAAVMDILSKLFDPVGKLAGHNPVYNELDWNAEQYSMGCPAAHFGPGEFLKNRNEVLLTPGNGAYAEKTGLYFASTEGALVSNGYMSGAIWSGETVAIQILEQLGTKQIPAPDTFSREIEMKTCINQIMKAIEMQVPMLEWPALTDDCNFQGPGGAALPTTPDGKTGYIGQEGTVEFYVRMGFFFAISQVAVETIAVDVERNTGFATFKVTGTVNTNGRPFKDMAATMLFEFTDPDEGPALIKSDRLIMDSAEIDALVSAAPASAPAYVTEDHFAPVIKEIEAVLGGVNSTLSAAFENAVIYGPGGKRMPKGPHLGVAGFQLMMNCLAAAPLTNGAKLKTFGLGPQQLTIMLGLDISGTTPSTGKPFTSQMTIEIRLANDAADPKIAMIRFSLDPYLID
ncbi:FAD-dependent oxidoreductase [uncultured Sulfitobacter sp.]|uniref:FAD-dependent oxidoreductase n=1 Tax=uncultured Sulfitobacter sp. TaxID=191468 RepID=UPI0026245085|nr:FAD-dependent oxidoreductase [uncultured Sulfitobacter sp.]